MIDPHTDPQSFLRQLYDAAVLRALPLHNTAAYLPTPPKGRTVVLGAGKAGGAMAQAVEALWPADKPMSGLVVTRYGHTPPRPAGVPERIEVVEASHPVPDAAGLAAAERILALTQGLTADDLVLCLISGGGSALLTLPADGLTLEDKQRINRDLLNSGAGIGEMNCVRKHLSRIKGGRLAAACAPAQVVTLTISDVPGDDPSVIASGPTVPDVTTCADAWAILQRYNIEVPAAIEAALKAGALETPKPSPAWDKQPVHLIATPQQSLDAAAELARAAGLHTYVLSGQGARRVGARSGQRPRSFQKALCDFEWRRNHRDHPKGRACGRALCAGQGGDRAAGGGHGAERSAARSAWPRRSRR
jgi:hydroxypyruvate reductase